MVARVQTIWYIALWPHIAPHRSISLHKQIPNSQDHSVPQAATGTLPAVVAYIPPVSLKEGH
jgi:hypothetical protein